MIRRLLRLLLVAAGLLLLLGGVLTGLAAGAVGGGTPIWLTVVVVLVAFALALGKLLRSPSGDSVTAAPWAAGGAIVDEAPEATPDSDPISGTELSTIIEQAATDARNAETVEVGLATVRDPLRDALVGVLTQSGWDADRIDGALASGSWTDDPVAAAVVDEAVQPPDRSLRQRLWAWLFPEKAVRRRTARAVGAIARTAEAELPPVVGQDAPRPVPVMQPKLEELQRASDGSLRRAVDGSPAVGAPEYDREDPDVDASDEREEKTEGPAPADSPPEPDWSEPTGGGD